MPSIILVREGPIARIKLNRPEVRNAINDELVLEFEKGLQEIEKDKSIRVVILSGEGDFFCAGGDLNWMKAFADAPRKKNEANSLRFAKLLARLNEFPKPTIAQVHGAAIGGGLGFVAACDIAVAFENTVFALAEVKLGLVPAVISPFVIGKMGTAAARRYFLTGERFTTDVALRIGLIHESVSLERLPAAVDEMARHLISSGPEALRHCKELIRKAGRGDASSSLRDYTAKKIASLAAGPEAREGMQAFLEKRKARWNA